MPGLDRTGRLGEGPRTGRRRGLCGSYLTRARWMIGSFRRGIGPGGFPLGRGRGRCFGGRGWGPPFEYAGAVTPSNEAEALRAEIAAAREHITAMEARLSQLERKD
jgi:hypothetical protein